MSVSVSVPNGLDSLRSLPRLAQALRGGGVRLGTGSLLMAAEALASIELSRREDVRESLRATLVGDPGDFALFDRLFDALFPGTVPLPQEIASLLPRAPGAPAAPALRRLADALLALGTVRSLARAEQNERDATGTASDRELLQRKDFEQMSARELEMARRLLSRMPARASLRRTRRYVRSASGSRLDLRRMLRAALRGDDFARPFRKTPRLTPRDWVLLVDVSGSMAIYSRMFLHFAHALGRSGRSLETFAFATRLTRISRALRPVDPDTALQAVAGAVSDWDGGTRIGECLAEFNLDWARRVLTRGAWVLLLTDGLERGPVMQLELEVRRLARSCRKLIWVNPLLRNASYHPLAAGAAVLDRYATERRSAHNVESLLDLARRLDGAGISLSS